MDFLLPKSERVLKFFALNLGLLGGLGLLHHSKGAKVAASWWFPGVDTVSKNQVKLFCVSNESIEQTWASDSNPNLQDL